MSEQEEKGAAAAEEAPHVAIHKAMKEKGVERVSALHDLFGKPIQVGDDDGKGGVTWSPATIDYAIGDRFRCRMEDGRQPWGMIAWIEETKDGLRFTTRAALDLPEAKEG